MKSKIVKPKNIGNTQNSQLHSSNYTNLLSASQQLEEARATLNYNKQQIQNEELFDIFMENSLVLPLNEAFEPQVKQMFHSEKCVLWIDQPEKQILYSPTYSLTAGYSNSIPGFICKTKNVIQVRDPSQAPGGFLSDPKIATPNSPQLFFPITTLGTVRGVVQIVKRQGSGGFTEIDMQITSQIMRKFSIYGDSLFTSRSLSQIALSLYSGNSNKSSNTSKKAANPLELLQKHFRCHKVELFHFDTTRNNCQMYDPNLHEMIPINPDNNNDFGLVGFSVTSQTTINSNNPKKESHFSELFDSQVEGPLLVVSSMFGKRDAWAVALRGRQKMFSTADESQLSALLPFLVRSIAGFSSSEEQSAFNSLLSELLEVAAILTSASSMATTRTTISSNSILTSSDSKSGDDSNKNSEDSNKNSEDSKSDDTVNGLAVISSECVEFAEIARLVEEKAASLLQCEKAIFYLVDRESKELVSLNSQRGRPRFPLGKGVSSQAVTENNVINLTDPVSDDHFSSEIDTYPGYTPKTILSAPIYDKTDICAVLLLLTKNDGCPFDGNDTKILKAFNVFVSISLTNAKQYQTSVKVTQKIRSYIDMTLHTNSEEKLKPLLKEIVNDFQTLLESTRISLFIVNDTKEEEIELFLSVGKSNEFGTTFSKKSLSKRSSITFNSSEIKKLFQNKQKIENTVRIQTISEIFENDNSYLTKSTPSSSRASTKDCEKIICIPLFDKNDTILGILEIYYSCPVKNEIDLHDSLSEIALLSLEKIDIKSLHVFGYGEIQLADWITDDEKGGYTTPNKLAIKDENDAKSILTSKFDAVRWEGIGLFKVIFFIFSRFDFMQSFEISNELLFNFLNEVKLLYSQGNSVSHNFRHAVSCTQFLTYMIIESEIEKNIEKVDLLVLILASLCHDMKYDFNVNSRSIDAYRILLKKGSLHETKSCTFAISIMSKEKCNLLQFFQNDEKKLEEIWSLFIQLVLSTDVSHHITDIEEMKDIVERGEFNIEEKIEHRRLLLINMIKCAALSNIARPFAVDDALDDLVVKCDVKNDEEGGSNYDKRIVAVYESFCLPLFEVVSKALPKLQGEFNQVKNKFDSLRKSTK